MRIRDRSGRDKIGIRCSFEFISRETQRTLSVAANAEPGRMGERPGYLAYYGKDIGDSLRSSLIDERGGVWEVSTSSVKGIGVVGVGWRHNPAEIVSLLKQRDKDTTGYLNRLSETPSIFGSTTSIPPGQSARVTMEFLRESRASASGPTAQFFQLESEIVVGVAVGANNSYALHNFSFDRVSMPIF